MHFDLFGLEVTSVVVDGVPATFSRVAHELVVEAPVGITDGSQFELSWSIPGQAREAERSRPGFVWLVQHD